MIAEIVEREIQFRADCFVNQSRNHHGAGFREALQSGRDIHPVAVDIVVLDDHVAEIDADTKPNPPALGNIRVALRHSVLKRDGASHRVDDAGEFRDQAIARGLDDAALMLGDAGVDQLDTMRGERGERTLLVLAHHS